MTRTQEQRTNYVRRVWYRLDSTRYVCHITDSIRIVRGPTQEPQKRYSYDVQLLHNNLWMPVSPILTCSQHAFRRANLVATQHAHLEEL